MPLIPFTDRGQQPITKAITIPPKHMHCLHQNRRQQSEQGRRFVDILIRSCQNMFDCYYGFYIPLGLAVFEKRIPSEFPYKTIQCIKMVIL